jgi:predicted DNA-binding ribbon-helix-helix protein
MGSSLLSRNITVAGHRTSMRLEPEMWDALFEICQREGLTPHEVCTVVDARRRASSLTAALRVFVMNYFRTAATEEGHTRASHGLGLLARPDSRREREGQGAAAPDHAPLRPMP